MRLSLVTLAMALLAAPLWAEPARVTVVTKDGRHFGTLSASQMEVKTNSEVVKVPMGEVLSVQFGDMDWVRTRAGRRVKGIIKVDNWLLKEEAAERPLPRGDLQFV